MQLLIVASLMVKLSVTYPHHRALKLKHYFAEENDTTLSVPVVGLYCSKLNLLIFYLFISFVKILLSKLNLFLDSFDGGRCL